MYEKITEKEIQFMECWYDPTALTECLIPENIKAAHTWNYEAKCILVRNYQFAMQNYSYMYGKRKALTDKENFKYKKVAGTIYNIAARNIGKSFEILIDAFLTVMHGRGDESCVASCDATHLNKIGSPLVNLFREHPFFEIFKKTGKTEGIKNRPIEVETMHGHVLYGRNEKIDDPEPGTQFHGLHYKTFFYEEYSYATGKGSEKRVDSGSSSGYIERLSGIADLRMGSPLGDLLRNKKNRPFICRIPQYVRDDWDEKAKEEQSAKYGGVHSPAYKLNVEAEVLEGAETKWDMERIRKKCLDVDQKIKFFEVDKQLFEDLDTYPENERKGVVADKLTKKLFLTRLPCKKVIIASDIGTTGSPSEIALFFGDENGIWKYHYQISLFYLTIKEQAYVFEWLYTVLGTAFISLDCTNADGRGIADELLKKGIPNTYISDFRMNQNMQVDFLRDDKGQVVLDKNRKPVMKEEYTKEFAVQQLEHLLYNGKVELPYDEKLITQLSNYWEKFTPGGRPIYGSSVEEHLIDSFLLFALCAWECETKSLINTASKNRCLGYI
jgi:hypothetical protein